MKLQTSDTFVPIGLLTNRAQEKPVTGSEWVQLQRCSHVVDCFVHLAFTVLQTGQITHRSCARAIGHLPRGLEVTLCLCEAAKNAVQVWGGVFVQSSTNQFFSLVHSDIVFERKVASLVRFITVTITVTVIVIVIVITITTDSEAISPPTPSTTALTSTHLFALAQ